MKTKNIFKALAVAMLMPATMLTTACSSDDDLAANNNEITNKKGFEIPVTINVTRQGDATTRATFDGSKLAFSAGDKLFVSGYYGGGYDKPFAGTLEYDTESGKFSGTIYTEDDTYSTYEALFAASEKIIATLLPAGYEDHGYLVIKTNDPDAQYDDYVEGSDEYTLATSKADGVAQFSYEEATSYSSGFALAPQNAILNFTITGLAASTSVNVSLKSMGYNITGTVTTDASGKATFAAGIMAGLNLYPFSLTVAGNPITIVSSDKVVEEGKIYNITRGTGATVDLSTKNANYTAQNGQTLTGTLTSKVQISIADGATVILHNVNINGTNSDSYNYAGITCNGDATIILSGTNTVKGFYEDYPGIYVPENKTVTIQGTGSLTASSNGWAAGIGGGNTGNCGNITITGGNITATGGSGRAGIGGGSGACGNITITGGTITATGGNNAAGIGGGTDGTCGNITITSGVTRVTATKGNYAPNSIGAGGDGTCGTVTIGGTVYPDGVTTSPFTYPAPSYTMAAAATTSDKGKLICTAGHIHVYGEDAACTAGRVAKIIYVGTTGHATYNHGLALALEDMSTNLTWDNTGTNNGGKTAAELCSAWNTSTPVTDAEWLLASKDQWDYMLGANGAGSYTTLLGGFTSVGGSNLQSGSYWSSTEVDSGNAWLYYFVDGYWLNDNKYLDYQVRACLAF